RRGVAATFAPRQRRGIATHRRHLKKAAQEGADVVGADVVGAMLGEGSGAIPALQQKALPRRNAAKGLFQVAGFACKHEWRERRKPLLDRGQRRLVGVFWHLGGRLAAPTLARPTLRHEGPPLRLNPRTGASFPLLGAYTHAPAP